MAFKSTAEGTPAPAIQGLSPCRPTPHRHPRPGIGRHSVPWLVPGLCLEAVSPHVSGRPARGLPPLWSVPTGCLQAEWRSLPHGASRHVAPFVRKRVRASRGEGPPPVPAQWFSGLARRSPACDRKSSRSKALRYGFRVLGDRKDRLAVRSALDLLLFRSHAGRSEEHTSEL